MTKAEEQLLAARERPPLDVPLSPFEKFMGRTEPIPGRGRIARAYRALGEAADVGLRGFGESIITLAGDIRHPSRLIPSFLPGHTEGPAGLTAMRQAFGKFEQRHGRRPTAQEKYDIIGRLDPTPWGVRGAAEAAGLLAIPAAARARASLVARGFGAGGAYKLPGIKPAAARVGAELLRPIAETEEAAEKGLRVVGGRIVRGLGAAARARRMRPRAPGELPTTRVQPGEEVVTDIPTTARPGAAPAAREERRWLEREVQDPEWGFASVGEEPERAVWGVKSGDTLETGSLDYVGYGEGPATLRGIHIGDSDFWKVQLEKDYGLSQADARTIKIRTIEGDAYLPDRQYNIPPEVGEMGESQVLVTKRTQLEYGKDWVFEGETFAPPTTARPGAAPAVRAADAEEILPSRVRTSILRIRAAVDEGIETYRRQGPRRAEVGGIPESEIPTGWRAGVDPQLESMGMRRPLPIEDVDIEDVKLEVAMEARADRLDAVAREMEKRGVKVPRDRNDFAKTDVYGEIEAVQRANTESGRRANTLLFDAIARRHGGKSIADEFDILGDVMPSETGGRLDLDRFSVDWVAQEGEVAGREIGEAAARDAAQVMDEVDNLLYAPTTARPGAAPAARAGAAAARGGGPPSQPSGPGVTSAPQPEDVLARIARRQVGKEKPTETLLRLHEGAVTTAETEARIVVEQGNARLKSLGVGRSIHGRLVPREEDVPRLDELFNTLHNPTRVAKGEVRVPPGLEDDYARLRELTDWEEAARLDFDPEMATVDDYFYRGWKVPEGMFADTGKLVRTRLGAPPPFKQPRVDATYQELREAGFEPLFWNPYEQWRVSRMQGVRDRQQAQLINDFKQLGLAVPDASGKGIKGWRTPEVGPAFEGKSFIATLPDGTTEIMWSKRWVVPNEFAAWLESIYGKIPDMGKVYVGGREIDLLKVIDAATFVPKRAKLFGSFFQQQDFLTRSLVGAWTGMVDALRAGQPVQAVKSLAIWPKSAYEMLQANMGPGARLRIKQTLNSTEPLLPDRPGVHFRGISEAGLSTIDATILPFDDLDKAIRVVAKEAGLLRSKKVLRLIGDMESAMRRGLFEGVYPSAQITDIRNNIAPIIARQFPRATDEQINGMIAKLTNVKYSTIPASQSVFRNRFVREALRRLFFSIGESEGLLRQAAGAIRGPQSAFWRKHFIGAYLGLLFVANTIHFASTKQLLPKERYTPISRTPHGLLPFGYNRDFASPNIPFTGRTSTQLTLDLVGQLDTAFRILDPVGFLTSRESVPARAATTQITNETFTGEPVDTVGPGGIVSRTAALASDLFLPIGPGQASAQIAREKIPALRGVIPEAEGRIGITGQLIQAPGFNVRAETNLQILSRHSPGDDFEVLDPFEKKEVRTLPELKQEMDARLATGVVRGDLYSEYYQDIADLDQKMAGRIAEVEENKVEPRNTAEAVNEYFEITREFAIRRNQLALDTFREREFDIDEEDPFKHALAEYYKAFDDARTPAGNFDTDKYNKLLAELNSKWKKEGTLDYVLANTHMSPVPRKIMNALKLHANKTWRAINASEAARERRRALHKAARE